MSTDIKILARVARIQGYCDSILLCAKDDAAQKIATKILALATEVLAALHTEEPS